MYWLLDHQLHEVFSGPPFSYVIVMWTNQKNRHKMIMIQSNTICFNGAAIYKNSYRYAKFYPLMFSPCILASCIAIKTSLVKCVTFEYWKLQRTFYDTFVKNELINIVIITSPCKCSRPCRYCCARRSFGLSSSVYVTLLERFPRCHCAAQNCSIYGCPP